MEARCQLLRRSAWTGLLALGALLAAVPAMASAEGTIDVKLTESPPSVTATTKTTTAGPTTFDAQNAGAIAHELVVIRTDLAADALPISGGQVDLGQVDVVADSQEFLPGAGGAVAADLTEGSYVLICNVPGHYGLGMRAALAVTDEPSAGTTPVAPTTGNAGLGAADEFNWGPALGLSSLAIALVLGAGVLVRRRSSGS